MTSVIQTLLEEHTNIRRLLGVLDHQVGLLERGADPDYDLLQGIANYFCDYPDRCHHPKEDAVFRHLQKKHPAEAARVGNLGREHRDAHARVRRFRENLQAIFRDEILSRETVVAAARSFVEAEREHMKMEEAVFFPIAVGILDQEDWHAIEADFKSVRDPLFGDIAEEEFRNLRDSLLAWEKNQG
jgi:hemerythrin-like domain-containing protein